MNKSLQITETKAAIERYEGYYTAEQSPDRRLEYWQHLIYLRAKLRDLDPGLFNEAKLAA